MIVNRLWQHHFGTGIVASSNNFGLLGSAPTHPRLLDHLAGELVCNDWHLKPIQRAIVLSRTYRMSSAWNEAAADVDPENRRLWRMPVRRLDAEQIRDSLLTVTGALNRRLHGPSFYPTVSAEVLAGQSRPGDGWGKSSAAEQARRSVYIHIKRSLIVPELANFDFPETDVSCEGRFNTTQPGQALGMINGRFVHERAAALADRVRRTGAETLAQQVDAAVGLVFQRDATATDHAEAERLVDDLREIDGIDDDLVLRFYCLALLNSNEFFYID